MRRTSNGPSINRSADAREAIRELYDRALRALPMAAESRMVSTRFGRDARPPRRAVGRSAARRVETVVIRDSGHILSSDAAARIAPRLAASFSR